MAATYVHIQSTAATTWTITHSLGASPTVQVTDTTGAVLSPTVEYTSATVVTLTHGTAKAGRAKLTSALTTVPSTTGATIIDHRGPGSGADRHRDRWGLAPMSSVTEHVSADVPQPFAVDFSALADRLEHPTRPPLPEEAHGDVFIAITERGGDGVADPSLGSLAAWFK